MLTSINSWFKRTPRNERAAHPRELLKSAGNVHIAVAALIIASVCILLSVRYDSANEDNALRRERQLLGLAFDQVRLNITSHVAGIASNFRVPEGRSGRDMLTAMHLSIVDSVNIAPSSLEVFLVHDGVPAAGVLKDGTSIQESFDRIRDPFQKLSNPLRSTSVFNSADLIKIGEELAVVAIAIASQREASAKGTTASAPVLVTVYWLDEAAIKLLRHKLLSPSLDVSLQPARTIHSKASLSLVNALGEPQGLLVWDKAGDRDDMRFHGLLLAGILFLTAIAVGVISRKKRLQISELVGEVEAQVYDVAMRDPLTGLLNRASFKRKLESLVANRRSNELIGIIYVDLDRFKQVNDGFGHLKGDELLCAVTERLNDLSSTGLTVARLGGDEFAMIVEDRNTPEAIMALAERACEALGFPFQLGDVEAVIGGSIGVSICPMDGDEHQELLRRADIAMYRAKTGGRSNTIRFDVSMDNDVQELRALEADLRHAIQRNELSLAYQPFWASDGETILGVEALLRWNHPKRGSVSPGFFIPIAEESGLIHDMGEWAIATAMRQCKPWGGIILAVNVSPSQFKRPGLGARIKELIIETGFEPERLEIEITEGVLIDDADTAVKFIRSFKEIGVHIALDDFGTGFSSLSYLRRFPFDKLKVDQSFVRALGSGPGTSAIIHSVIALGRALGMTVHAEGVETLEHHIFLRAAGCHHLQGFLFSRPLTPEAFEALMLTKTVRPAAKPMFADARNAAPLPVTSQQARDHQADLDAAGPDLSAQLRARVAEMKLALGGHDTVQVPPPPSETNPTSQPAMSTGS
ncbi:MAG: putative bifunctional diguanylate cyclase/phosphodiesterase [Bosea sp. (in: a-proteobacteria)]